mgnify:CR=1 FL=1
MERAECGRYDVNLFTLLRGRLLTRSKGVGGTGTKRLSMEAHRELQLQARHLDIFAGHRELQLQARHLDIFAGLREL